MSGRGYLVTVIGAAIGAALLAWPVGYLGVTLETGGEPADGFEGLLGAFIGGTVGVATGSALGSWIGLRVVGQPHRLSTAVLAAILGPASIVFGMFAFQALTGSYSTTYVVPGLCFVGAMLVARSVSLYLMKDTSATETS